MYDVDYSFYYPYGKSIYYPYGKYEVSEISDSFIKKHLNNNSWSAFAINQ